MVGLFNETPLHLDIVLFEILYAFAFSYLVGLPYKRTEKEDILERMAKPGPKGKMSGEGTRRSKWPGDWGLPRPHKWENVWCLSVPFGLGHR